MCKDIITERAVTGNPQGHNSTICKTVSTVLTEYLLHTRTLADAQKFPTPVLAPFPVY